MRTLLFVLQMVVWLGGGYWLVGYWEADKTIQIFFAYGLTGLASIYLVSIIQLYLANRQLRRVFQGDEPTDDGFYGDKS